MQASDLHVLKTTGGLRRALEEMVLLIVVLHSRHGGKRTVRLQSPRQLIIRQQLLLVRIQLLIHDHLLFGVAYWVEAIVQASWHVALLLETPETLQLDGPLFGLAQLGALDALEVLQRLLLIVDLLLLSRPTVAHAPRIDQLFFNCARNEQVRVAVLYLIRQFLQLLSKRERILRRGLPHGRQSE